MNSSSRAWPVLLSCGLACAKPATGDGTANDCSVAAPPVASDEACIGAGTFVMGHPKLSKPDAAPERAFVAMPSNDWAPQRRVRLSPFIMDRYEVTWGRYLRCVRAGLCTNAGADRLPSTSAALRTPAHAKRPAYGITYQEAFEFCLFERKRLPTEAEWERAARGPAGKTYPWGDDPPRPGLLAVRTFYPIGARQVGSFPPEVGSNVEDVTDEGVHDMFTSVPEWVSDWYDDTNDTDGVSMDPVGPAGPRRTIRPHEYGRGAFTGANRGRVVRGDRWSAAGGAEWDTRTLGAPAWFREQKSPDGSAGFRCVRDVDPRLHAARFVASPGFLWVPFGRKR